MNRLYTFDRYNFEYMTIKDYTCLANDPTFRKASSSFLSAERRFWYDSCRNFFAKETQETAQTFLHNDTDVFC